MVTLETISIVFTGISISLAAFYYINTLRNTQRNQQLTLETRRAQHYMQLLQSISTEEFLKRTRDVQKIEINNFEEYLEYTRDSESQDGLKFNAYCTWVNGIGHMLHEGVIDEEMIHNFGSGIYLGLAWSTLKPFILEYRERINCPWHMVGLEYMAEEQKRWRKERSWPYEYSLELGRFIEDK